MDWELQLFRVGASSKENTRTTEGIVEGKLYLKMHNIFMTKPVDEGKSDFFMTIEQIEGDE